MATASLRQRLDHAEWTSPTSFSLGGLTFGLTDVGAPRPEPPQIALKKPRRFLELYADVLDGRPVRNVLELGLNHGGSAALFATLLEPEKLVSLDISGPVARFDQLCADHPVGRRIVAKYRTSQADEAALRSILDEEFDGPLDLVLDDASHDYGLTRASFEILFPRIQPGGCYALEDWQWAHAPGFWDRQDQPALSNLLFQLLMVNAGRPELIGKIEVYSGVAFIWRGAAPVSGQRLDIESLCFMQNRSFSLL